MTGGNADFAIWVGVALYLLGVLALGLHAARHVHDNADYLVAGRRLPLWLCTFSLFATWFGGGTAIGAAGAAYEDGLLGVIADPFGAALCLFLFGAFYAKVLRRLELLTVADFFRHRFGGHAEPLAALCLIPACVGWVGSQFVAFGFILNALTGVDTTLAILGGAGFVILYTMAGGLWAVSLTDAVQALVLTVGMSRPMGGQWQHDRWPAGLGRALDRRHDLARRPARRRRLSRHVRAAGLASKGRGRGLMASLPFRRHTLEPDPENWPRLEGLVREWRSPRTRRSLDRP